MSQYTYMLTQMGEIYILQANQRVEVKRWMSKHWDRLE